MQDKNTIDQLKEILNEREKKVKQLENDLQTAQFNQFREHTNNQLQFILHGNTSNNNNNNNKTENTVVNDEHERFGSSLNSSRNNSRNELMSTRLASANNNNSQKVNNNNNSRLSSAHDIAATRQALKGTKISSRPNSATGHNNNHLKKEYEELKLQYHELVTLNKSSDIERTRLLELVKTLQKRLENLNEKYVDVENKFNEQRRRCVNLEKQVEKANLESNSSSNG